MLVTNDTFAEALHEITLAQRVVVDTETNGLSPYHGHFLVGISILIPGSMQTYYFSFRHASDNLPPECLKQLMMVLKDKEWTGWNSKFDLKMLRKELFRYGVDAYPPRCEDAMTASHFLDENQPNFKLKNTGDRMAKYIGFEPKEASAAQTALDKVMAERGLGHGDMWRVAGGLVAPYAEADVLITEKLRNLYVEALKRWNLYDLWQESNDYLIVINKMEERGLRLDQERIAHNIEHADIEAARCIADVRKLSGIPHLNPNSAQVFKAWLNVELMIGYGTSITTTDHAQLEELLGIVPESNKLHTIIKESVEYRRWAKVNGTYYKAFLHHQAREILHPNLHMTGTVTGRFSSSEPNMQSIPREEEEFQPKNHVKEVFMARDGYWLVEMDLKMAEIFLGAHIARAKNMIQMLKDGHDIHAETGKLTGTVRSIAKRMNFAIMFGVGARTFVLDVKKMANLVITLEQAEGYINQYNQVHPEMKKMYQDCLNEARDNGFIRMLTGRVRRYNGSEEYSSDGYKPSPYPKASSNKVQGSVAEAMRLASTGISHQLGHKAHQLLHVHDSIISEVREGDYETIEEMKNIMCLKEIGGQTLAVPMRVDVKIGTRWSELKPMKEFMELEKK